MTFKERLIKEEQELTEKLCKLQIFLTKNDYDKIVTDKYQLDLLQDQEYHMAEYAKILRARIADIEVK